MTTLAAAESTEVVVSCVVPGVDCTTVPVSTFTPRGENEPDEHAWSSAIGPRRVEETDLNWFYSPRSAHEALTLMFGEEWRIDFLPSVPDGDRFALLTHRRTGGRLMARLTGEAHDWCGNPSVPVGEDLTQKPTTPEGLPMWRRTWLQGRGYSAVDTEDLRTMIAAIGIRPEQPRPAPGDELELAWLLCAGLIEVWLAEHGYTGDDAVAVRTMVRLGGLAALDAYDRVPSTATA